MVEIFERLLAYPATNYILSFGSLGVLILLALNGMHKNFQLTERTWGLITLATGIVGGLLIQAGGLIALPAGAPLLANLLAAFMGAATAAAAAGFSAVDLRDTMRKPKD